jgi:hypothetical protein
MTIVQAAATASSHRCSSAGESDYTGPARRHPGQRSWGSFNFANLAWPTSTASRLSAVRKARSTDPTPLQALCRFSRAAARVSARGRAQVSRRRRHVSDYPLCRRHRRQRGAATMRSLHASTLINDVLNGSFNQETVATNMDGRSRAAGIARRVPAIMAARSPGPWAIRPPDPDEYYRHRSLTGGVAVTYSATPSWTQRAAYSINRSWQFSADPQDSGSFIPQYRNRTAPWPSFDFVYQTLNNTETQRVSYETSHLGIALTAAKLARSGVIGDPIFNPPHGARQLRVYVQDQWEFRTCCLRPRRTSRHNGSASLYPQASRGLASRPPRQRPRIHQSETNRAWHQGPTSSIFSQSPYFRGPPSPRRPSLMQVSSRALQRGEGQSRQHIF